MDVETAVQLERLEEVERAIIALDPGQFVRRDELSAHGGTNGTAMPSPANPLAAPQPLTPTITADY